MEMTHVSGEKRGKIILFALSTCGWCRKTKEFLNQRGIDYSYVDVDRLNGAERDEVMREVERWNPMRTFPTLVVDDRTVVAGYKPEEIEDALRHE